MILDEIDPVWVHILPEEQNHPGSDYLEHYGKWLIYGSRNRMERLAEALDQLVETGKIDQAKYTKRDPRFDPLPNRKMHVMCVYCDDRERERVWKLLEACDVKRRVWKYDRQTIADWLPGGKLEREARKFIRSENCASPEHLISLDGDYLVRTAVKETGKILKNEQEKIAFGIRQTYGIRHGSCADAILEYIKSWIPISGVEETCFFKSIYDVAGKWSRSTVRKNLKRFEELGLLERMYFCELDVDHKEVYRNLSNMLGEKIPNLGRERVFSIKIHLPDSILNQAPEPTDPVVVVGIKTAKEGHDLLLGRGEHVIDKIDLRNLSEKEKRRAAAGFLKQPFFGIELPESSYDYTHEERVGILRQVSEETKKLDNVKELYSVGSVPNGEDTRKSDVDVLVVREYCPGFGNCGARLKNANAVDLFCFTEEELKEGGRRKLAILVGAERLYEKPNLTQPVSSNLS